MSMKFVLIKELDSYDKEYKIRVRVCRLWRGRRYTEGLHCVLVDEKGDGIHAHALEGDYEFLCNKIKQGHVYNISNFFVRRVPSSYNVLDNPYELLFNTRTIFKPLENSFPTIPQHRFSLLEFNQLHKRINNHKVLTDLFGCLISTREPIIKEGASYRCEIFLQNLRREEIKITLWEDVAKSVMEDTKNLPSPVLLVVTSLRISQYNDQPTPAATDHTCVFINPDIPQTDSYRKEFSNSGNIIRAAVSPRTQMTNVEVEQQRKISVHELNKLDPEHYKDQLVYCRDSICRYSPNINWWYEACPQCYKQLKKKENNELRICQDHDMQVPLPCYRLQVTIEDSNNEATLKLRGKQAELLFGLSCKDLINKYSYSSHQSLPHEIIQTVGQIHTFQVQITDRHELIIKGIFPDTLSLTTDVECEPMTSTPAPVVYDKKRTSEKTKSELSSREAKKKPRSDESNEGFESTMSASEKQPDMKKKND